MSKRAVVLAGGKGSRLRPYSAVLPKPLMPVGDDPILAVILQQLAMYGFDRVTLAVNYQAEIIKAYCGDGSRWGLKIDYSLETVPLSTIAPLKLIPDLPDDFVLLNGDVLTDADIGRLYDEHVRSGRLFTISAAERTHLVDFGVLEADSCNRLTGFQEKPKLNYLVSMGIYVVNRAVLEMIPEGRKYGFDDLMLDFLRQGRPVHIERFRGYWLDIGRVDDYMQAVDEFESMRPRLLRHVQ
ncbi:MAG: sugar phosphate nucleotidyltransferase [Bryobacteraceae bacterium]|jgi:NDP-sugar pyrophosphorylase family protein